MSIYATGWSIRLPVGNGVPTGNWIEVFAQIVPDHIGQPSEGYGEGDPYADFLPPITENYDPNSEDDTARAIVVVQKDREKKDGQRYIEPVLTMDYEEYRKMPFEDFLREIYKGLKRLNPDLF